MIEETDHQDNVMMLDVIQGNYLLGDGAETENSVAFDCNKNLSLKQEKLNKSKV